MVSNLVRGVLSNLIGVTILFGVAYPMNLVPSALVSLSINWVVYLVHALPQNSEKFFDATGSLTYLSLVGSAVVFSGDIHSVRQIVNPTMVVVWCVRLGSYLLLRIMRDGTDSRFDELKKNWLRFLGIWTIQADWCFLVVCPVLVVLTSTPCKSAPTPYDYAGWCVWILGFLMEVIADRQKDAFRKDPANKGKFITTGLWAYSRHPNYFGEISMWIGICISGSSCFAGWTWCAWLSPLTTVILLLKVSGVPMLEAKGQQTWGELPEYQWYMQHTPCIVPALKRPPAFSSAGGYIKIS